MRCIHLALSVAPVSPRFGARLRGSSARDRPQSLTVQGKETAETPLVVVLNWFEELTRLVPTNEWLTSGAGFTSIRATRCTARGTRMPVHWTRIWTYRARPTLYCDVLASPDAGGDS